jgi:Zn-dependent metalloprotease
VSLIDTITAPIVAPVRAVANALGGDRHTTAAPRAAKSSALSLDTTWSADLTYGAEIAENPIFAQTAIDTSRALLEAAQRSQQKPALSTQLNRQIRTPVAQPPRTTPPPVSGVTRTSHAQVRVFDASRPTADGRAGLIAASTGAAAASGRSDAAAAAKNVQLGLDYYASKFGRNGLNNAGRGVEIVINDRSTDANNVELFKGNGGYYTTTMADGTSYEAIRWGSGDTYQHANGGTVDQYSMLYAEDLTIHELTHGIIKSETGALGGEANESGATNEALADIMAASATHDWRMGEKMYKSDSDYTMLRDIANPQNAHAVHDLQTNMNEVRAAQASGQFEEHIASGVISHAVANMQQRIGGEAGWNAVERMTYKAITGKRLGDMSFQQTANALRWAAFQEFGNDQRYAIVWDELQKAGL